MRRRDFIAGLGGAAAWPLAGGAQQGQRVRRIGVLMAWDEDDPASRIVVAGLTQGLAKLGWTDGQNLTIDYRWGMFDVGRARAATLELLAKAPDVILANGTPSVQGVQSVTRTVPTVFTLVTEPVAQGFIESLAHPGGNLTGFSYLAPTIGSKWFELLKEIAPQVTRLAFIVYPPGSPYGGLFYGSIQLAAARIGVQTTLAPVYQPTEFEQVLAGFSREPGGGLIVNPEAFMATHRREIIALAARYSLPAIYFRRNFATDGGLVSYGVDDLEHFRQVSVYLNRILRGEKTTDLPVQQPIKFELVINRKTANVLGLTVPNTLLVNADDVIE
jgi:putative ABC transport system substrate-binding protein